ncbi:uncharacterized protein BKCO1_25000100 [Diplodia corticola]|uniref:Uncharacterized protein n=1 Tax=Diplodia corticola TaxID=236234 RepID=A0A1J9R0D8_9PEZI|nr:uncharacterized protein BKCO1_25000100 [Diplodia corticola]OJD34088.1 hypothetical protein BKCO1_25000100 [Diplodia corticola]
MGLLRSASSFGNRMLPYVQRPLLARSKTQQNAIRSRSFSTTNLRTALKQCFNRYRELRNAKRLPRQLLWSFITGRNTKGRWQKVHAPLESDQGAIQYFTGTCSRKDIQGVEFIRARAIGKGFSNMKEKLEIVEGLVKGIKQDIGDHEREEATFQHSLSRDIHDKATNKIAETPYRHAEALSTVDQDAKHIEGAKDTSAMDWIAKYVPDPAGHARTSESTSTSAKEVATFPVQNCLTETTDTTLERTPLREDVSRTDKSELFLTEPATFFKPNADRAKSPDTLSSSRKTAIGTLEFLTGVLKPRGVIIDSDMPNKANCAFEHFKSVVPPASSTRFEYYRKLKGLEGNTVWINYGSEVVRGILNNYSEMQQKGLGPLCEPEWVDDAIQFLLKRESRKRIATFSDNPSQWRPVRMREESFQPQYDGLWEMPPIIHGDLPANRTHPMNVEPDCSYWIWAGGFRPEVRCKISLYASVRFDRALCPYLTVEVKKDPTGRKKGRQQIVTAGSIVLYNRWRLRQRAIRTKDESFVPGALSDVRHYGLLLAGVQYEFWCLEPTFLDKHGCSTGGWNGCVMKQVYADSLDTECGIKHYIDWINEIHRWGNTEHSSGCFSDIEALYRHEN